MKADYLFEKNYRYIRKYKPTISHIITKPDKIEQITPNYGINTAKAILTEEYSKYKPLIDKCTVGFIFCIEPEIMKELFARYTWYRHLYLIFPSVDYFCQLLCNFDLTELIKKDSFKPIFGTGLILEQSIMINCEKVDVMHNGIRIFAYKPFDEISEGLLKQTTEILSKMATSLHVNLNTCIQFLNKLMINELRAIPKIAKYNSIEILRDIYKDKPVICVAAAPSLSRQLELLKSVKDNAIIVAAIAALKPLLNAGIKPDICTCLDMDDVIEKYFIDIDLKGIYIAIEMSSYYGCIENHPEANYIISQSSRHGKKYLNNILQALKIATPDQSMIQGAMTVAMMSIQLANLVGAKEIFLIGMDLSYESSETHASGNQLSGGMKIDKYNGQDCFFFEKYGEKDNVIMPVFWEEGNKQEKVPVTCQFKAYKNYINTFLEMKGYPDRTYNCADGGQKIPCLKWMEFKDACTVIKNYNYIKTPMNIPRLREKMDFSKGIEYLEKKISDYINLKSICDNGIDELNKSLPNFDIVNNFIKLVLIDNNEDTNNVAQNNDAYYYLYKYIELSNNKHDAKRLAIDNRNRARLLFKSISMNMEFLMTEYKSIVKKLKEEL